MTGRGSRRCWGSWSSEHELSLFLPSFLTGVILSTSASGRKCLPFLSLQVHASPAHRIRSVWGLHSAVDKGPWDGILESPGLGFPRPRFRSRFIPDSWVKLGKAIFSPFSPKPGMVGFTTFSYSSSFKHQYFCCWYLYIGHNHVLEALPLSPSWKVSLSLDELAHHKVKLY